MELVFKETKKRLSQLRGRDQHWLIRIPNKTTLDGFYTLGKISKARSYRSWNERVSPKGWCLSLNSDTDLTIDELNQVRHFIGGLNG